MPISKSAHVHGKARGKWFIKIPAALQAQVGAPLAVSDVGKWVDASPYMRSYSPSTPSDTSADFFVTGSDDAITLADNRNVKVSESIVMVDNNGQMEDVGLASAVNIYRHILIPLAQNTIPCDMRYSPKGKVGDELREYTDCQVTGVGESDTNADQASAPAERTMQFKRPQYPNSYATLA